VGQRSGPPRAASRLLRGLGLARRAGQLRIGVDAVQRAVRSSEAAAVVIASDAPPPVQRRLERLLSSRSLPHTVVLDGDRLGRAVGRERVVALAVTDESLGQRVLELARALEG
jgi:ribosomal protein L7Ae-like RNA K-turn-binding protein